MLVFRHVARTSAMRNTSSHNIVVRNSQERSNTEDEYTNVNLKLITVLKVIGYGYLDRGHVTGFVVINFHVH